MKYLISFIFLCMNTIMYAQNTLPIIKLTGNFGYDYQEGTVSLIYPDNSSENNLSAKIKWRGGSTNTEGKHKRNYKIKFSENHSFFGLRNDNNWILDAGQADVFRLRNRIATELWNDFASKPYYIDQEPNALSGVRGQVVEVYLNEEYMGIYCFTECLDRKQMKLKKFDKDETIHGCLWKSSDYGCSTMYQVPDNYDNSQSMMDVFEAKYPEPGEDLPETDYSVLWNAINFVANSSDEEFTNQVADYFDIPAIIDYYLFINILNALDNVGKNMYWAVYDKQKNNKITPAIWDLDLTIGSHALEQYHSAFSSPYYNIGDGLNIITRLKSLNVDNFNQKVTQRYIELRKSYFSTNSLISRYKKYYDILKSSGTAQREQNRWSGDSDVFGEVIDFDNEIKYISNWISDHMQYIDDNYFDYKEATSINNITYQNSDHAIYTLTGIKIKNPKKGIYIKNNRKIIIK